MPWTYPGQTMREDPRYHSQCKKTLDTIVIAGQSLLYRLLYNLTKLEARLSLSCSVKLSFIVSIRLSLTYSRLLQVLDDWGCRHLHFMKSTGRQDVFRLSEHRLPRRCFICHHLTHTHAPTHRKTEYFSPSIWAEPGRAGLSVYKKQLQTSDWPQMLPSILISETH